MYTEHLHNIPEIREGLDYLLAHDPVFCLQHITPDNFLWPYMRPGFSGLVRIIIGQQLSVKAAASLWARFEKNAAPVTPARILTLSDNDMRALGLSQQKTACIRGLAQAVSTERINLEMLQQSSDADIVNTLTSLKGIGLWSAQMYLMFSLARPDIWAPGDLGIREGLRSYFQLPQRPDAQQATEMGDRFRPHRTAASLLLWRL